MRRLKAFVLFFVMVDCGWAGAQIPEGRYRIMNLVDDLHITTEGANTDFARIVAENWQNFGEQRWKVEKSGISTYNLLPEKHTTNNVLSYYRDPSRKHALPQQWNIIPLPNNFYQIQNHRTGQCLISNGRRKEIVEGSCDKYLPDRRWKFIPI